MNVLFATSAAPFKSPFSTGEKRPPLGLGTLISVIRNKGHKVFFIDNYLTPSNFMENGFLQKNKIDFVGIYANTICFRDTLRMFSAINELRVKGEWSGKIIVGGPHVSVQIDTIPDYVDYVVKEEGEVAIVDIIEGRARERIIKSERIKNLDTLPFEPWDLFKQLPYDYSCEWFDTKPVYTLNTSRGCPFRCTFCSVGAIWGSHYTCFSADRIIAEIEYLVKNYGAKGIYFREDNFTFDRHRIEGFCRALSRKNILIDWACESRVETLCDESLVRDIGKAGCRAVYLGVESGSQRMLDMLNKGIKVEQIEKAVGLCNKYNIRAYCSLIAGVPGETFKDYLLTLELMQRIKPYKFSFNVFVGIPGSRLYDKILNEQLYDYKDDLGLLYLPGFHIKARYFYGVDSCNLVDYEFDKETEYDKELLARLRHRDLSRYMSMSVPYLFKAVARRIRNYA